MSRPADGLYVCPFCGELHRYETQPHDDDLADDADESLRSWGEAMATRAREHAFNYDAYSIMKEYDDE